MENKPVFETLVALLAEILECSTEELNQKPNFREHSSWDSLAHLSTVAMIDETFGVVLRQADFKDINTVSQLAEYVAARKAS